MDLEERHLSGHGNSPDYLTCGDCAREFMLENITLFIAHKKWDCSEKVRARRCADGTDDVEEDTSSPLTCSVCSRVFMTARGLLHHVQCEHGMTICLKRGPLMIMDKNLRCSDDHSATDLKKPHRQLKSPAAFQSLCEIAERDVLSEKERVERCAATPKDSYRSFNADAVTGNVENVNENDPQHEEEQRRGREQCNREKSDEHPRNLSQSSNISTNSVRYRFSPEECFSPRSSTDQLQKGNHVPEKSSDSLNKERMPRSSSIPKKRRFTAPDQNEERDTNFKAVEHDEVFAQAEASYPCSAISKDNSTLRRKDSTMSDTQCGPDEEGLGRATDSIDFHSDERNIDSNQYYNEDMESPICLVVNKATNFQETDGENVKNVILKKLLLHNGATQNIEYASMEDVQNLPLDLPVMPKLEIDTANLLVNPFDTNYIEAKDRSQTNSLSTSSSALQQQEQQRPYMRARDPVFQSEASLEQSIEQIIRATVNKEVNDLNASNDSLEHSPPHLLASRYSGSHALPVTTNSFQGIPMTMPSLIASHQLGAVAGYFSPEHYPTAGHRRGSVGALQHSIPSRSVTTSPGSMSTPDKVLDISNPLETGGLYPGSSMPCLALGYQHKPGMDMMRRGANDFTGRLRHATASIYRGEVNIHHWATMAGDAYVNSMTNRLSPDQLSEAHGIGSDFNDRKMLLDVSLKKRRYPTSRPFKCTHCDQAFNQRIHLKKHMSKHTGVKPFKCQQCDYSTVERSHLKVHYRIHTGEKPYKCLFCDYATAQNSTLKIHLKRHHEGQQLSAKDIKASKNMRRDNHRASIENVRDDFDSSDSVKVLENHEIDARQDKGYSGSSAEINQRQMSTTEGDKDVRSDNSYLSMSQSPRQDLHEVETDSAGNYHRYKNYQVRSGAPAKPAPDLESRTPRNNAHGQIPSPAWHQISETRQRVHLDHQHEQRNRMSFAGHPEFPLGRSLQINNSPSQNSNVKKALDEVTLNFSSSPSSSSDNCWRDQNQTEIERNDMAKLELQDGMLNVKEQDLRLNESVEMSHGSGVEKLSQQQGAAAVPDKPELIEDGNLSDDDLEHVDFEVAKKVIPDKAFVRG